MRKNSISFGLPEKVEYCKKCLMSNQRPNMCSEHNNQLEQKKTGIHFENGICEACRYNENKNKNIDWEKREFDLNNILDKYRSRNGSYDVVVPGSGGKDSFYVSHKLKYKYKMNPITVTFAPNIYTKWGRNNFDNWINAGFPNYLFTCNGIIHSLVTRLALDNILHPFQPWILGQKNLPPKFANNMKIPLLFYGDEPAEYGNPSDESDETMNEKFFSQEDGKEIFIAGLPKNKIKKDLGLQEADFDAYTPIKKSDINPDFRFCVFSRFAKWHPQENYYYTVQNSRNFKVSPERTLGTYTKHASIDDKIDDLHYYTAYIKFGIGRVFYDVAQEIRSGDITIEEGLSLIKQYNGEYPKRFMEDYISYLSIDPNEIPKASTLISELNFSEEYFNELCDKFRPPHIWSKENNVWKNKNLIESIINNDKY